MSDNALLSPLLTRFDARAKRPDNPTEPAGDDGEQVARGETYATVKGQRVAHSIEFIPRDADPFVIPYAYLPLLWPRRPNILLIEYPILFTVRLRGKEPDAVKRLIRDQRIVWIRECSEAEAAALDVAITSIDILRIYPSREAGIDPHGKS
jgi:hypothetical protein